MAHRQAPSVFATYFELVFALKANRLDEAAGLWRRIAAAVGDTPSLDVAPLTAEALGEDAARFVRLLNAGEKGAIFGPPDAAEWPAFAAGVTEAFSLLEQTDAALAAEMRALIVLVIGSAPLSPALSFGGVTSLTLWGAVTLNTEIHRTPLEIAGGLVHEGGAYAFVRLCGRRAAGPQSRFGALRLAPASRSAPDGRRLPRDIRLRAACTCFIVVCSNAVPQSLRGLDPRAIEKQDGAAGEPFRRRRPAHRRQGQFDSARGEDIALVCRLHVP